MNNYKLIKLAHVCDLYNACRYLYRVKMAEGLNIQFNNDLRMDGRGISHGQFYLPRYNMSSNAIGLGYTSNVDDAVNYMNKLQRQFQAKNPTARIRNLKSFFDTNGIDITNGGRQFTKEDLWYNRAIRKNLDKWQKYQQAGNYVQPGAGYGTTGMSNAAVEATKSVPKPVQQPQYGVPARVNQPGVPANVSQQGALAPVNQNTALANQTGRPVANPNVIDVKATTPTQPRAALGHTPVNTIDARWYDPLTYEKIKNNKNWSKGGIDPNSVSTNMGIKPSTAAYNKVFKGSNMYNYFNGGKPVGINPLANFRQDLAALRMKPTEMLANSKYKINPAMRRYGAAGMTAGAGLGLGLGAAGAYAGYNGGNWLADRMGLSQDSGWRTALQYGVGALGGAAGLWAGYGAGSRGGKAMVGKFGGPKFTGKGGFNKFNVPKPFMR